MNTSLHFLASYQIPINTAAFLMSLTRNTVHSTEWQDMTKWIFTIHTWNSKSVQHIPLVNGSKANWNCIWTYFEWKPNHLWSWIQPNRFSFRMAREKQIRLSQMVCRLRACRFDELNETTQGVTEQFAQPSLNELHEIRENQDDRYSSYRRVRLHWTVNI